MSAQPPTVQTSPTGHLNPISENADNRDSEIRIRGSEEANISSENYSDTTKSSSSLGIILRRFLDVLNWVPPSCRYDPENPREFTLALNLLFGFAGTFTVPTYSPKSYIFLAQGMRSV